MFWLSYQPIRPQQPMALMILYRQNSRKSKIKNCVNVNQKPTENHLFYVVAYYEKCSVYKKIIFIINPQGIYLLTKTSSYSFNLKRYTQALVFNTCPSYKHYFGTFSKWGLWRGCPAWSGISLLPGEALVPLPRPTLPSSTMPPPLWW